MGSNKWGQSKNYVIRGEILLETNKWGQSKNLKPNILTLAHALGVIGEPRVLNN